MKKLTTPFGSFNVYLNRLAETEEETFHISFVDKDNKVHIIMMKWASDTLSFVNVEQLPEWVFSMRQQLIDLIMHETLMEKVA
jgi:hypothetical protein